jgi:hypothetical protein
MRLSKLTQELALALEVASIQQAWGNPSPFQDKINELLVKAGRKPVAPNKARTRLPVGGRELPAKKNYRKVSLPAKSG